MRRRSFIISYFSLFCVYAKRASSSGTDSAKDLKVKRRRSDPIEQGMEEIK